MTTDSRGTVMRKIEVEIDPETFAANGADVFITLYVSETRAQTMLLTRAEAVELARRLYQEWPSLYPKGEE